ncbi:hypothetical protein BDC45DRAFT_523801 [Circinella umbellata]|nr:hypothetical protein BDC45DRAFT_523801 [Circinella umbellata]
MLTTKSLILTTDPVSVLSTTTTTDLFKSQSSCHDSLVQEYNGSSDVTSDQSTDLSPSLSEEEEVDEDYGDKRSSFPLISTNTATSTTISIDSSNNSIYFHEEQDVMQQHDDISPIQLPSPSTTTNTTTTSLLLSSSHFVPIVLERNVQDCISVSMLDIYERLLPTRDAYERRRKFITKVETILDSEWKDHDIRVHLFGSSENDLGTSTSDVDICLTTSWPGLKCVRTLATVLKKHGMQKVHTVPRAKVPIVKMWDPIYQLACDMNVNSSLALHNTRMIKTYVAIDPRVRPLAMLIKYWTRQRALNNAADGGTLSTYTWTCMIINFLQTREPPILPVLHQMGEHSSYTASSTTTRDPVIVDGLDTSFYSDIESLRYFGERNHESLGGLLFAFFRRFAYEFDYETQVVSVRHGLYLSKQEKGWHEGPNKRLFCIEEPFNVYRNLGNSADDASVYGLQAEFRRAVHILLETKSLEALCAKHVSTPPPSLSLPLTAVSNPASPLSSSSPMLLPTCHHYTPDLSFVTTATTRSKSNNDNMTTLSTKIANTMASPSSRHYSHKRVSNSNITTTALPHVMPMTRIPSSTSSTGNSSSSNNSSNSGVTSNTSNSSSSKSFSALSSPTQPLPSAQLIPMFHHTIPSDLTPNNNNCNSNSNSDTTTPVHHYMYLPHPLPSPPATTISNINNNNSNSITNTTTFSTNTNQHLHYQNYPYYVYYHSNNDIKGSNIPDNVYNQHQQRQQQKHKEQKSSKLRKSYTPNFARNQLQHQQQQPRKQAGDVVVDRHCSYMELSLQRNNQQQSRQQQSRKNNNKSRNSSKPSSTITPPLYNRQQRVPQEQPLPQYINGNNANTIRRSFWDNSNCSKNYYHNSKKGRGKQQQHSVKSAFDNNLANSNNVDFVYLHHPQIMK